MMYVVESFFFNFLRKKVEEGNKELDIGKYHLIFRYADVEYGILYKEEEEVKDIKKFRDSVTKDDRNFEFNVNELVYDVTNINEEFVTQMMLERESNIMYLIPERTDENVNLFLKALSEYVKRNKNSKTGKVVK